MSTPQKRVFITSALPYINGIKHLGNLVGSMLTADVFARFQRARGMETLFVCATDEHGSMTELAAMEAGQLPLDRLLDGYRRGARLLGYCRGRLEAVEQQVQVLEAGELKPWTAAA